MSDNTILNSPKTYIAFIMDNVPDWKAIEAESAGQGIETVVLDSKKDGLAQMADYLDWKTGIGAIHLISHGSSGNIDLGAVTLSNDNLGAYEETLAQIGTSLSEDGDFLVYGCNVAQGEKGVELIGKLAKATGADIAASDDATGAAAKGGDWVLESNHGLIGAETISMICEGLLAEPSDQNFDSAGLGDKGSQSYTLNGVIYTTNDSGGLNINIVNDGNIASGADLALGYRSSGVNNTTQVTFQSSDGSEFKLNSFLISTGLGDTTVTIKGYRNNEVIATSSITTASFTTFNVSANTLWQYIDEVRITGADLDIDIDDLDFSPAVEPMTISINDASLAEGNSGTQTMQFTVSRTNSAGALTVDYATGDNTATAGNDYTAASGTLIFADGEASKTISVTVNGDTTPENNETFFINLSNASGGTVADGQGQGTINNDDNYAPTITAGTTTSFTEQTTTAVAPGITVSDPDGDAGWNGGTLKIQITGNASADDRLTLPTTNTGAIWLNVADGSKPLMNGVTQIGTASANAVTGGTEWVLTFNANATNVLVQNVARAVQFGNDSDDPATTNRTITFTATDSVGGTNSATQTVTVTSVNDAPQITNRTDPALQFAGNASSYAVFPDVDASIVASQAVTLEGWVKFNDLSGVQFISSGGNGALNHLELHTSGAALRFIPTQNAFFDTGNVLTAGQWTHIVATYNANTDVAEIYINGIKVTATDASAVADSALQNGTSYFLGKRSDNSYPLNGSIAEFRIWNDIRTNDEILNNMNVTLQGNEANLVALWKLDEGSGTVLNDSTPNSFNGTANSSSWTTRPVSGGLTVNYTEDASPVGLFNGITVSTVESGQSITGMTLTVTNVSDVSERLHIDGSTINLANGSGSTATSGMSYVVNVIAGTATVSLSKAAGLTEAQAGALINSIAYSSSSQDPTISNQRVVTLTSLQDNGGGADTAAPNISSTVTLSAISDAPTLSATAVNPTYTENGSAADLFSAVSASTIESGQVITQLTLTVSGLSDGASEILSADGAGIVLTNGMNGTTATNSMDYSVSVIGGTATVTLIKGAGISSSAATTLIDGLGYSNSSDTPTTGNRVVTLTGIKDNGGTANGGSDTTSVSIASTVTVASVNDSPTINAQASINVTEDVASALTGISFADVDAGNTSVTATFSLASGSLSATSGGGVTVGGTSQALTLTGSISNINTFISGSNLNFVTASNSTSNVTLTVDIDDGGNTGGGGAKTASTTVTLAVSAVNDSPAANAPATISVTEDVASAITGISFSDVDAGSNPVGVSFSAVSGTLAATSGGGVTVTGSGTSNLGLSGTVANINTFVSGSNVTFATASNATGDVTLTTTINDLGNTGSGGPKTNSQTTTIQVASVNDAPSITNLNGDTRSFNIGGSAISLDAGVDATVSDVDSSDFNGGNLTVSITANVQASEDVLDIISQGTGAGQIGVSGTDITYGGTIIGTKSGGASGTDLVISLNANSSSVAVQALIRALTYANTDTLTANTSARTISITVSDGDGGVSSAQAITVSLVRAPIIDLDGNDSSGGTSGGYAGAFTENGGGVAIIDSDATLSDDGANLNQATISIGNSKAGDIITLGAHNSGDVVNGITITYNSSSLITMTGSASKADYLSIIKEAFFNNTSDNPDTTTRIINFSARDTDNNTGTSVAAQITMAALNDAPVASGSSVLAAVNEDTVSPAGETVANLFSANFDDSLDGGGPLAGIAITGYTADSLKGIWQYGVIDGGSTNWTTITNISGDNTALTLSATALMRFVPAANFNGNSPGLTTRLIDSSTSVTNGAIIDASLNGGTTAISAAVVGLSSSINSVNDMPSMTAEAINPIFLKNGSWVNVFRNTVIDTVELGQNINDLAITVSGVSNGSDERISYFGNIDIPLANGTNTLHIAGPSTPTSTVQDLIINSISYKNYSSDPVSGNRVITITILQDDGGTANGGHDSWNSTFSSTITIDTVSPVITGPVGNPGDVSSSLNIQENTTAVGQFTSNETVTWTLEGADAAKFQISGGGSLTFNTAPDFENPQDLGDTAGNNTYEVVVKSTDGSGNYSIQTTTINVSDANDDPSITSNGGGATAAINIAENTTAVTTLTATDVDAGQTVTYSITGGADQAKFSINANSGALSFASAPNFEAPTDNGANNTYEVIVQANDGNGGTDNQTITVTVTDVNESVTPPPPPPPSPDPTPTPTPNPVIPPQSEWGNLPDNDNDGVPEVVEGFVPGLTGGVTGDGNGDGVQDQLQSGVSSVPFLKTTTPVSDPGDAPQVFLTIVGGSDEGAIDPGTSPVTFKDVRQLDAPTDLPENVEMPLGMISFTADIETPGTSENFSIFVDASVAINGYWKQNFEGAWVNLASPEYGGQIVTEGGKTRLDFAILDGGEFDNDGEADGVITDPGAPGWRDIALAFDENYYLESKLAELRTDGLTQYVDIRQVKREIINAGMTVYEHFQKYSLMEGTSPNKYVNTAEYLQAKAVQLNSVSFDGRTDWSADDIKNGLLSAGYTNVLDHFSTSGWLENVNPSNSFDISDYLRISADAGGRSVSDFIESLKQNGLDPFTQFITEGQNTAGVSVPVVSGSEKVVTDHVNTSVFNETLYLQSKLVRLITGGFTQFSSIGQVFSGIADSGMTAFEHFKNYSLSEETDPNQFFDTSEYLQAKADKMNALASEGRTDWTKDDVKNGLIQAGYTNAFDHFATYGWLEDVNPSSEFDVSKYLESYASNTGTDLDTVIETFRESGTDPLTNYLHYGQNISGIAVKTASKSIDEGEKMASNQTDASMLQASDVNRIIQDMAGFGDNKGMVLTGMNDTRNTPDLCNIINTACKAPL